MLQEEEAGLATLSGLPPQAPFPLKIWSEQEGEDLRAAAGLRVGTALCPGTQRDKQRKRE